MDIKVNYQGYECNVLGKERYKAILQKHNIFTKQHTIGRIKACKQELQEAVNDKLGLKK